jgi:hypothetical protein
MAEARDQLADFTANIPGMGAALVDPSTLTELSSILGLVVFFKSAI